MDERAVPRSADERGSSELTTLLLRLLSANCAGRALDLLAAGGGPPGTDPGPEDRPVYALVDMASDDPDEPLAAAMVLGPEEGGRAEVRALAVSDGYEGLGLDGRILAAVIDLLRTTGARRVLAFPSHDVDDAHLYREAGFRPVAAAPHALDSCYELELSGPRHMHLGVLGGLEVLSDDGVRIEVPTQKLRSLLALLVIEVDRVVAVDRIIDQLWGDQPPATATGTLQA
ncbi:MAG: GNAT family N-acetyltransferase [Acidimicrobiales bacterium]